MKILSITAQKPNSTGSGVYLTELVRSFSEAGHTQAVLAGVYEDDQVELPEGVSFYPVYFNTPSLPYNIAGMSDEMPYPSTRYRDMTPEMTECFEKAFLIALDKAVCDLDPDIIICHHLYLLTAIVREHFPDRKIYGVCHNTDLRQMIKTDLKRAYIADKIRKLDRIFVPGYTQKDEVVRVYNADPSRISLVGMGYNKDIFYNKNIRPEDGICRIVFAGKIAEKKGLMSLLRALDHLKLDPEKVEFTLVGGAGNKEEYDTIVSMAEKSPYKILFPGKLPQIKLAEIYNRSDIFILPSFFDSIPLVVIEALACGCRVVVTDLPGIRPWLLANAPGADIRFVTLPEMQNADEPVPSQLPDFEKRLADSLLASIEHDDGKVADTSSISWAGLAKKVLERV